MAALRRRSSRRTPAPSNGPYAPLSTAVGDPALRTWWAALANRESGCDILAVGDSVTEGFGANVGTRWVDLFRDNLRARYPLTTAVTGGKGYTPAFYRGAGFPNPTLANAPTVDASFGLGRRDLSLTTTGQTITFTFTGTAFRLFYGKNTTTGTFSYAVDGGGAVNVSGTNAVPLGGFNVNVTGLAVASHTVVVSWVSGTTFIEGIFAYNGDEATGIRLWEAGSYGYTSSQVTLNYFWSGALTTIQPSLVVIELGVNDMTTSVSSATFQTNIAALIANLKTRTTISPSFVLMALYQRGGSFAEPWSNYVTAMKTVAAADANNVTVFDLSVRMDPAVSANTLGLYNADLLHPAPKGHRFIADALTGFTRPR